MNVTASNMSAALSQVGDVSLTAKIGTSQYHGSVFEYLQNQALDADPYGSSGKAPKKFNTFGFSLSGPIVIPHLYDGHSKTFFFADYEGNRRSTAVFQQYVVPTPAYRSGNLSDIGGPTISSTQISQTAKALLAYYPLPNVAGPLNQTQAINYQNFQTTPASTDGADVRADQTISSKQSYYA